MMLSIVVTSGMGGYRNTRVYRMKSKNGFAGFRTSVLLAWKSCAVLYFSIVKTPPSSSGVCLGKFRWNASLCLRTAR